MSNRVLENCLFVAGLVIVMSAVEARAQLSPAGSYFGKLGTNDVVVGVARSDVLAFYHFDKTLHRVEVAVGTLSAAGKSIMTLSSGRTVSLTLSGPSVTGSIAGSSFSASLQSAIGPFASKAQGYTGTMSNPSASINILSLIIMPSGKAVLISSDPVDGIQGGIGTITNSGDVSVSMTNGYTYSLHFDPLEGTVIGTISSSLFGDRQYILVQQKTAPLVNISTRGTVGGASNLIAGFVTSTNAKMLLIRAVGPTMSAYGVTNPQQNPKLTLYLGNAAIATNDDWESASNSAEIASAAAQVGAFPLPAGSKDAALLVTLDPGVYTAVVSGNSGAGDALVEVYEVR